MSERITQKMLDIAIDRLAEKTKLPLVTNNCYGYSQLAFSRENGGIKQINASLGDSKKDLYYQIQFCLEVLSELDNQS